jgi:hypothetical protein
MKFPYIFYRKVGYKYEKKKYIISGSGYDQPNKLKTITNSKQ